MLLFFWLLINKIKTNKRADRSGKQRISYEWMLKETLEGVGERIKRPSSQEEMETLKEVILEAFDKYHPSYYEALRYIAREVGFVEEELKALSNSSTLRKAIGAYALGVLRVPEAVPFLLKIDTQDLVLRQCIYRALIQIDGLKYVDWILAQIDTREISQKARVLELFTEVQEDLFVFMEQYLQGEDVPKKALALEVLGERQDLRVKPYLAEIILSEEKELKGSAIKAAISLKCFECSAQKERIPELLNHPDWEVRAFTAKAMTYAKDPDDEIFHGLGKYLEDGNWTVRFNAAESLFALGEKGMVVLSEMLSSPDRFAREKAWDVLNREWSLFGLEERMQSFQKGSEILGRMEAYRRKQMEEEVNDR